MNKLLWYTITSAFFIIVSGVADAKDGKGGFCKVEETRLANKRDDLLEKKLWEYTKEKLPESPVMGYIDIACADRGEPRADLQDLGKRIWFNVAGPEGASVDKGKITVSESALSSVQGDVGISVKGMSVYSVITPRHDCAYSVSVWMDDCGSR